MLRFSFICLFYLILIYPRKIIEKLQKSKIVTRNKIAQIRGMRKAKFLQALMARNYWEALE